MFVGKRLLELRKSHVVATAARELAVESAILAAAPLVSGATLGLIGNGYTPLVAC